MRRIGFKSVLITSVTLVTAICVSAVSYILYKQESKVLAEIIYSKIENAVQHEAEKITNYIEIRARATHELASNYINNNYQDNHHERMILVERSIDVASVIIGLDNGEAYTSSDAWPNHKAPINYDPRKRPWYTQGKNAEGIFYTDSYRDATSDSLMISIGEKVNGGVILTDITLDVLNDTISDINYPGSISFIISDDTTVLATNSPALKNGEKLLDNAKFSSLANQIINAENSIINYILDGKETVSFSKRISLGKKNWHFVIALNKSVVFSDLNEAKYTAIIITLLSIVITCTFMFILLRIIYTSILNLKETIISLSKGDSDLTQRLEVKSDDDLGQIANGVNLFIENLQHIMIEIRKACGDLHSNVEMMNSQANKNSNIIERHIIETEQVVTAIEEMSATASTVAANSADTAQFTQKANTTADVSKGIVNQAQQTVQALINDVDDAASKVQAMNVETQSINTILEVIGGIAAQINLLALNAAIEAARAGEHGRGFAVVADEVRSLAGRTQTSTAEIEEALNRLLEGNASVVEAMNLTKFRCEEAANSTIEVSNSLAIMTDHVAEINDLSTQIATTAEEQSSVTQEISRNIASINDMVVEISSNAKNGKHQTENVADINSKLLKAIGKFKF